MQGVEYNEYTGKAYVHGKEVCIHVQRGRKYINYKNKQINIKCLPKSDPLFDYIFNYGFKKNPNEAYDKAIIERYFPHAKRNYK